MSVFGIRQFRLENKNPTELFSNFKQLFKVFSKNEEGLFFSGNLKNLSVLNKFSSFKPKIYFLICHQPIPDNFLNFSQRIAKDIASFEGGGFGYEVAYGERFSNHFGIELNCKGITLYFHDSMSMEDNNKLNEESSIRSFLDHITTFLDKNLSLLDIKVKFKITDHGLNIWPRFHAYIDKDCTYNQSTFTLECGINGISVEIKPNSGRIEDAIQLFFLLLKHQDASPVRYQINIIKPAHIPSIEDSLIEKVELEGAKVNLSFLEELEKQKELIDGELFFTFQTNIADLEEENLVDIVLKISSSFGIEFYAEKSGGFDEYDIMLIEEKSGLTLEEDEEII